MAILTLKGRMPTGESEPRGGVIEIHRSPAVSSMTSRAIVTKAAADVVGITDCGEVVAVAAVAISRSVGVSGCVTARAINCPMRSC